MIQWPWPPGTIVVCIGPQGPVAPDPRQQEFITKYPVKGEYYTIREARSVPDNGVLLNEIVNKINPYWGMEQGWYANEFRPAESDHNEARIKKTARA